MPSNATDNWLTRKLAAFRQPVASGARAIPDSQCLEPDELERRIRYYQARAAARLPLFIRPMRRKARP